MAIESVTDLRPFFFPRCKYSQRRAGACVLNQVHSNLLTESFYGPEFQYFFIPGSSSLLCYRSAKIFVDENCVFVWPFKDNVIYQARKDFYLIIIEREEN